MNKGRVARLSHFFSSTIYISLHQQVILISIRRIFKIEPILSRIRQNPQINNGILDRGYNESYDLRIRNFIWSR